MNLDHYPWKQKARRLPLLILVAGAFGLGFAAGSCKAQDDDPFIEVISPEGRKARILQEDRDFDALQWEYEQERRYMEQQEQRMEAQRRQREIDQENRDRYQRNLENRRSWKR